MNLNSFIFYLLFIFLIIGDADGRQKERTWHPQLKEALRESKLTKKNTLVYFTGYTCGACIVETEELFNDSVVSDYLSGYVLTRLYVDDGSPLNEYNRKLEEREFHTIVQPVFVILSPKHKKLAIHEARFRSKDAIIKFLAPFKK